MTVIDTLALHGARPTVRRLVAIAGVVIAAEIAANDQEVNSWITDEVDEFTDRRTLIINVRADLSDTAETRYWLSAHRTGNGQYNPRGGYLGMICADTIDVSLMVRWSGKAFMAKLAYAENDGLHEERPSTWDIVHDEAARKKYEEAGRQSILTVRLRFDDDPQIVFHDWLKFASGHAVGNMPDVDTVGRQVLSLTKDRLIARVEDSETMHFDLVAARKNLADFRARCVEWQAEEKKRIEAKID